MIEHNKQFDDLDRHVSDRLRKDLRDLFEPPGAVPPRVDEAILEQASRRLAKPRRLILRLRWAAGIAAAAVIVIGVVLHNTNPQSEIRNPKSFGPALTEDWADIDGNGRVDILDAFRLARYIEARGPMDTRWDLNGDGRVDQDDVDLVAFAAVHLGPEPQARRGEGVPPLRRAAILASLLPSRDAPVAPGVQGPGSPSAICSRLGTHDALATNLSADPLDKGV
jgi:hypothetical protein